MKKVLLILLAAGVLFFAGGCSNAPPYPSPSYIPVSPTLSQTDIIVPPIPSDFPTGTPFQALP